MTFEMMKELKQIDLALMNYGSSNKSISSIIALLEMAYPDYKEKKKNCYRLLIIKEGNDLDSFIDLIECLNMIGRIVPISSYKLTSKTFETEKVFSISEESKDVTLQVEVYTEEEFKNLSPTLKYYYGKRYRPILGLDYLEGSQLKNLTLEDLENDIFNFLEVLKDQTDQATALYLLPEFLNNIYNYCKLNDYVVPSDKIVFFMKLLGTKSFPNEYLYILQGIFNKTPELITELFKEPRQKLIAFLSLLQEGLKQLEILFPKEEAKKTNKPISIF